MANAAPAAINADGRFDNFRQQRTFVEGFEDYVSGRLWTLTTADSATAVLTAAAAGLQGGQLVVSAAGATLNDEAYVFRTVSQMLFEDGVSFRVKSRIKFAQAATNKAAIHFGLLNAPAANAIVDTTGVPKSSFSGALIYTKADSIYWQAGCSVGTALQTTASSKIAGGSSIQELEISIQCNNGVAVIEYFVDGVQLLYEESFGVSIPIKHSLTYSGAAAMTGYFGMKQCSATQQAMTILGYAEQLTYGPW